MDKAREEWRRGRQVTDYLEQLSRTQLQVNPLNRQITASQINYAMQVTATIPVRPIHSTVSTRLGTWLTQSSFSYKQTTRLYGWKSLLALSPIRFGMHDTRTAISAKLISVGEERGLLGVSPGADCQRICRVVGPRFRVSIQLARAFSFLICREASFRSHSSVRMRFRADVRPCLCQV